MGTIFSTLLRSGTQGRIEYLDRIAHTESMSLESVMRIKSAMVIALLILQFQSIALAGELNRRITALGENSTYKDLEHLDQIGCSAVPALVDELHVVTNRELTADEQSKEPSASHVVWVIAALRYITGLDFYGQTSKSALSRYSARAQLFLRQFAPPGETKFFGSWMSHGTLYFAPATAQRQIIREWKYYAAAGNCPSSTWPRHKKADSWFFGDGEH
jgi:hypothetical protein